MTFINKGGVPFLVPVNDSKELEAITSYAKWDQAFKVFTDVITSRYPEKTTKLLQYNHVIYTASQTYVWDNVYSYDKDFRLHIARNPFRTWAVILQQAWSMRLKDKVRYHDSSAGNAGQGGYKKDYCQRFQKGKCHLGLSCKFDHRWAICNKFGHGAHICRRRGERGNRGDKSEHYSNREGSDYHYHYYGDKDVRDKCTGAGRIVKHDECKDVKK